MKNRIKTICSICEDMFLLDCLKSGLKAALNAGELLREFYYNSHEIRYKGRIDLVTEADIASEKIILDILLSDTDYPVMAEESGMSDGVDSGMIWIVDPLDGTTNFAHGFQVFAVSIALVHIKDGFFEPEIGIVYCPMQDELFWAVRRKGAWLETESIKVSVENDISKSLIGTGFPYAIKEKVDDVVEILKKMLLVSQGVRRAGAAAVDLAWTAAGRLDGFYEIDLKPWDTAAGYLVVKEAGGMVTDFSGRNFNMQFPEIVASNGFIHQKLLSILSSEG